MSSGIGRPPIAVVQRLALEQLHRDEALPLDLVDRVDGADVRMVERGGGPRLALEARLGIAVARPLGREKLERHGAPELQVLGAVDDAHAAGPELLDDLVVQDGAADHGGFYLTGNAVPGSGCQVPGSRSAFRVPGSWSGFRFGSGFIRNQQEPPELGTLEPGTPAPGTARPSTDLA